MRLAICITLFLAAACTGESPSAAFDADSVPRLALVEELRIGSRDDPDTGFSTISQVDVDRDDQVYVYEQQQGAIRVYDPRGRLVRTIGRRGAGPGEFQRPINFWVVGDTIWTYETRGLSGLITRFDRMGAVLSTGKTNAAVRFRTRDTLGMIVPRRVRDDGRLETQTLVIEPNPLTDTITTAALLIDATGAVVDTAGWDKWGPPRPSAGKSAPPIDVGGTKYRVPIPPDSTAPLESHDGNRVVVTFLPEGTAPARAFTVTRLGSTRDTLMHRRFSYSPRRYDEPVLDALTWQSVREPAGNYAFINGAVVLPPMRADSMAAFAAVRGAVRFPEHQRPVHEIMVQRDSTIWLRREDDGTSTVRWLLLRADGRARAEVGVPRGVTIVWNRGDVAWGIERDDADVPWLVKYRIAERAADAK